MKPKIIHETSYHYDQPVRGLVQSLRLTPSVFEGQRVVDWTISVSGGQRVSVESFILDYHGNLYNRQVRLEFYKFLRPERKFDSVDALKARILYDADTTRAYFEAQTQRA